jgi:hypothetical protein
MYTAYVVEFRSGIPVSAILCTVWFSFTFSWGLTCIGHICRFRARGEYNPKSLIKCN